MTDLTTLTDDELRVKAAEAMGYKEGKIAWMSPDGEYGLPDPLHDLNGAVALAEHWRKHLPNNCSYWKIFSPQEDNTFEACVVDVRDPPNYGNADSPARALTLAVLKALEDTS